MEREREERSVNKMESKVVVKSKNETWAYNMVLVSHRMEMGTMTQDLYI